MKYLIFLLVSMLVAAQAVGAENFFRTYGRTPVPVYNRTGAAGKGQKLYLVKRDGDELIFRYQPKSNQEIGIPIDTQELKLYFELPKTYFEARDAMDVGDYEGSVELLRPIVYPLIQYLSVPDESFNIHAIVSDFYTSLVRTDNHDEAIAVARRLPLHRVDQSFVNNTVLLTHALVDAGKINDALTSLNKVPLSENHKANVGLVMGLATKLKDGKKYQEAMFIYKKIEDLKGTEESKVALLWTAYCHIMMGNLQSGKAFLTQLTNIGRDSESYSLKKLIEGHLYLLEENYLEAMRHLSQGVVFSQVNYSWMPELLFQTGLCYEKLSNPDTAREIYGEINLFYSETDWANEAKGRLSELPPPKSKAKKS